MDKNSAEKLLHWFVKFASHDGPIYLCRNKKCANFGLLESKKIRFYGNRPQKLSGENKKRYQCLICKKIFTGRFIFNDPKIKDLSPFFKLMSEWDKFKTYRQISKELGIPIISVSKFLKLVAQAQMKEFCRLDIFRPEYSQLVEIPCSKINKSFDAVFFEIKDDPRKILSLWVCEDTPRKKGQFIKALKDRRNLFYVSSKTNYRATPMLDFHCIERMGLVAFLKTKELAFNKWCKAKSIKELQQRMLLFSLIYKNRFKPELASEKEASKKSQEKLWAKLRAEVLKRKSA